MTKHDILLDVQHVSHVFPLTKQVSVKALDDVSFQIRRGEIFGLVGESGSGKSTVARLALRLIDPDAGSVLFRGEDITRWSQQRLRHLRGDMSLVFQDPYSSLNPRHRIGTIIGRVLRTHGLPADQHSIASLLDQVGLDSTFANRYPHQFSGGQRQRIGIARALASSPSLLIADEPVSALDVSVRAQILNLLADLRDERQLALVLISHDLAVVKSVADRVVVMHHGQIVEHGPVDEVYADPKDPYTRALLAAVPVPDPSKRRRRSRLVS